MTQEFQKLKKINFLIPSLCFHVTGPQTRGGGGHGFFCQRIELFSKSSAMSVKFSFPLPPPLSNLCRIPCQQGILGPLPVGRLHSLPKRMDYDPCQWLGGRGARGPCPPLNRGANGDKGAQKLFACNIFG